MPVIDCDTKPGGRCNNLLGAVAVEVLWMFDDTTNINKLNQDAPWHMDRVDDDDVVIQSWDAKTAKDVTDPFNGEQRWNSFVKAFNLQNPDGSPASWADKTLYYAPDCDPVNSLGGTGGPNFGIRSAVPVLVF